MGILPPGTEPRPVWRLEGNRFVRRDQPVVREVFLEVRAAGRRIAVIACAGLHLQELAVGYLRSEGVIRNRDDVLDAVLAAEGCVVDVTLRHDAASLPPPEGRRIASSGAHSRIEAPPASPAGPAPRCLSLTPEGIAGLMQCLVAACPLHEVTGGTHAAALADGCGLLVVREDIGRHNALDMLAGYALLAGIDCAGKIIVRTGRISSEIIHKVRVLGVSMVISLSTATNAAVDLAAREGIALVGSVRAGGMTIYTGEEMVCR